MIVFWRSGMEQAYLLHSTIEVFLHTRIQNGCSLISPQVGFRIVPNVCSYKNCDCAKDSKNDQRGLKTTPRMAKKEPQPMYSMIPYVTQQAPNDPLLRVTFPVFQAAVRNK